MEVYKLDEFKKEDTMLFVVGLQEQAGWTTPGMRAI